MNSMQRITVTVPDELAEDARAAVTAGQARSVSAYVADALRVYRQRPTLRELLDTWDDELGEVPNEIANQVDDDVRRLAGDAGSGPA